MSISADETNIQNVNTKKCYVKLTHHTISVNKVEQQE